MHAAGRVAVAAAAKRSEAGADGWGPLRTPRHNPEDDRLGRAATPRSRAARCGKSRAGGTAAAAVGIPQRPRAVRPAQKPARQQSFGPISRPPTASTAATPAPRAALGRGSAGGGGVRSMDGPRPARRLDPRRPRTLGPWPEEGCRARTVGASAPACQTVPASAQGDGEALPRHRDHAPRAPRLYGRAAVRTQAPTAPRAREASAAGESQ